MGGQERHRQGQCLLGPPPARREGVPGAPSLHTRRPEGSQTSRQQPVSDRQTGLAACLPTTIEGRRSRGRGRDREGEPPGSTRSPSSALPSPLLPLSRSTHADSGSLASGQLPSRFSHAARLTLGPRKGKQGQQRVPRCVLSRVAPTSPADERRSAGRSLPGTVDTFDDAHRPLGRSCEHRHELDYRWRRRTRAMCSERPTASEANGRQARQESKLKSTLRRSEDEERGGRRMDQC
jgi:hypothetical protein